MPICHYHAIPYECWSPFKEHLFNDKWLQITLTIGTVTLEAVSKVTVSNQGGIKC